MAEPPPRSPGNRTVGSGAELETYLILIQDLKLATKADVAESQALLDEVMRMLNKFSASLAAKP